MNSLRIRGGCRADPHGDSRGPDPVAAFAELAGEVRLDDWQEALAEADEVARAETARMSLWERLAAASGLEVSVALRGAEEVRGRVEVLVEDFVLLCDSPSGFWLIPLVHLETIVGLPARMAAPAGGEPSGEPSDGRCSAGGLSVARILRVAQSMSADVTLHLQGTALAGRLAGVARDHLDLDPALAGPRVTVPLGSLTAIRVGIPWS